MKWTTMMMAGLVAWSSVGAQEAPAPAPRPTTPRPRVEVRGPRGFAYAFTTDRGVIGINAQSEADPATDSIGAKLAAVTPGSPAARAGLRAGDIVTKYNGTALGGERSEERGYSGPAHKLLELAQAVEPGDTVKLEYRRGNERKTASVVAVAYAAVYGDPDVTVYTDNLRRVMEQAWDVEGGARMLAGSMFGDWSDMELVTLNAELGEYFGTREGILVVKAPEDSSLGLRSGDVILSVAGRKATSPSHLMRILRSYEPGEALSLEVMRRQRKITVNGQIPERRRTGTIRRTPRPGSGPFWQGEGGRF